MKIISNVDHQVETCSCGWKYYYHLRGGQPCGRCKQILAPAPVKNPPSRTQKVKGLLALRSCFGNTLTPLYVFSSPEEVDTDGVTDGMVKGKFGRPCPERPRHGFLDSRLLSGVEDLKKMITETLAADPGGEVMIMDYMESTFNTVWTPSLLCIGKGNDGATCGKQTVNFPLSGKNPLPQKLIEKAAIGEHEWPYIEAVFEGLSPHLTQLRAGPIGDSFPDYIPRTEEVKEVITVDTSSSLMEWEEKIKSLEGMNGIAIYHPGGSMVDHFSVHARSFQIPVITTWEVKVGETIEQTKEIPPDPRAVLKGLLLGEQASLLNAQAAVNLLLLSLHNSSAMSRERGVWIGVGAAIMMRLGACALKGEARHLKMGKGDKPERETVYKRAFPYSLRRHRAAVPRLIHILRYGDFGGSSVGGRKWALCGAALSKMFDAVASLARTPNQLTLGELIRSYNSAVNQAHNGGWWLNKFSDTNAFNLAQDGDILLLLRTVPLIMSIAELSISDTEVERKTEMWGRWRPISLRPIPIQEAEISFVPGVSGVGITVKDRMLKAKHKPIQITFDSLFPALTNLIGKENMYVVSGDDGLRVEVRKPHIDPTIIWEEEKLEGSAMVVKS